MSGSRYNPLKEEWEDNPEPSYWNPNKGMYEPIHPVRVPIKNIVRNSHDGWRCMKNAEHKVEDNFHGKKCPWCNAPLVKVKES